MTAVLAPQRIISLSALLLLCTITLSGYLATAQPWLGLTLGVAPEGGALLVLEVDATGPAAGRLQKGDQLLSLGGNALLLQPSDLMEEPDELATYSNYNSFINRQGIIHKSLTLPQLTLQLDQDRVEIITPHSSRPLSTLPLLFWYQIACGSIVFLAGMSILAFRPREKVTIYYALTGFGLLLASSSAAIYSTRELAMDGDLFYSLSLINQFGAYLFAGPFISILWYYPQRIHRFPLGPVVIGSFLLCWLLNLFQVYDSIDALMRYPVLVGLVLNLALAITQWRLSQNQPVQRAILKWFLLAWLSGSTLYVGLHTIPLMLHYNSVLGQSLSWGILLTIYLGIALGITRYRLFDLDRWVISGWFWLLGGLVVLAIDALLVSLLDLNDNLALAITLAIAGWLYFPLRQLIWFRLSSNPKSTIDYRDLFPELLTVMLNTQQQVLAKEWAQLLHRLFLPLNIEPTTDTTSQVHIGSEGVTLTIPGFKDIDGVQLSYADRGSRLFNKEDVRLADAVRQLFSRIQHFREAFDEGVHEERRRVARDLHDDVGAKLLTLVYSAPNEEQAELARESLQELRAVIRDLEHKHYSLSVSLAELRIETAKRCKQRNTTLQWNQSDELSDSPLESRQHSNLQRTVREAVTNALRHSNSGTIQIDVQEEDHLLTLQISNDGVTGNNTPPYKPGRGMSNIRSRCQELSGSVEWRQGDDSVLGGCTVSITIPIRTKEQHE